MSCKSNCDCFNFLNKLIVFLANFSEKTIEVVFSEYHDKIKKLTVALFHIFARKLLATDFY